MNQCATGDQCAIGDQCATGDHSIYDKDGYSVCIECGYIVESTIYESVIYDLPQDFISRLVQSSSSFISKGSTSSITTNGKIVKRDIHRFHVSTVSVRDNSYIKLIKKLDNMTRYSRNVIEIASDYAKIVDNNVTKFRGKNKIGIDACCVYYACLRNEFSITPKEVCKDFDVTIKQFNKSDMILRDIMKNVNIDLSELSGTSKLSIHKIIEMYIQKYASELETECKLTNYYEIYKKCLNILNRDIDELICFRPQHVAITLLYIITDINKSYIVNNKYITYPTLGRIISSLSISKSN